MHTHDYRVMHDKITHLPSIDPQCKHTACLFFRCTEWPNKNDPKNCFRSRSCMWDEFKDLMFYVCVRSTKVFYTSSIYTYRYIKMHADNSIYNFIFENFMYIYVERRRRRGDRVSWMGLRRKLVSTYKFTHKKMCSIESELLIVLMFFFYLYNFYIYAEHISRIIFARN